MKRAAVWFPVSTVVVLFVGYLALTAGTRFFLPSACDEIEVGMSEKDFLESLPPDWDITQFHYPYTARINNFTPNDMAEEWYVVEYRKSPAEVQYRVEGRIGFRSWGYWLLFTEGNAESIETGHHDWHSVQWYRLQSQI